MEYFASQDPRSYSFYFDLNICFRAQKCYRDFQETDPWPQPELDFMMTSPKFSTWRSNQGARSRVTFQLFATPRSDLFPQYFRSFAFEWWGSKRVGKNGNWWSFECSLKVKLLKTRVFQLKDLPDEAQNIWRQKVCFNFLIFGKNIFEIYIKFACWWWFCCRSAKHFHIVLCVWICNSELRHVRIFVTPCSFYVLLQCDRKARSFFGIKMPVGWQNFIENPNCPDCVGWSKEQCSFATRDRCLTDRADLNVGPTLRFEKSDRVFWIIAPNWTTK